MESTLIFSFHLEFLDGVMNDIIRTNKIKKFKRKNVENLNKIKLEPLISRQPKNGTGYRPLT